MAHWANKVTSDRGDSSLTTAIWFSHTQIHQKGTDDRRRTEKKWDVTNTGNKDNTNTMHLSNKCLQHKLAMGQWSRGFAKQLCDWSME